MPFGGGEGQDQLAGCDPRQQRGLLRLVAAMAQEAAAEHDRRQIGLDSQGLAEALHHDHRLDRAAIGAAKPFGEGQAQEAQLGQLPP